MTVSSTAQLNADLRFRGAPLAARGAYRMLLDFQDACGDVSARGLDAVGAVAAALGCLRDEARDLLLVMERHDLVRLEVERVCLLVGSRRGKHGGDSGAERVRRHRAAAKAAKAAEATDGAACNAPCNANVTAGNGQVTAEVRGNTADSAACNDSRVPDANPDRDRDPSPVPPAPLPGSLPPPLASPSLSLTLSPLPTQTPPPARASAPPARGEWPSGGLGGETGQGDLFESGAVPRLTAREQLGLDAVAALDAVRQRAKGLLNASHDARSVAAWQGLVRELAARAADPVTTVGAYEVLGDWIAAGGFAWMTRGRPTLALLLRPGKLAELLDEARTWDAAGRSPLARRTPAAPAAAPGRGPARRLVGAAPVSTAEDFARDAAGPDPLQELLRKANLQ